MNNSKIDIDEVIYTLLQGLKSKGYSIGTDTYIKTTQVFYWFLEAKKGNTIADFAPFLAPVICKSDNEQAGFKLVFKELFTDKFKAFEKEFFKEVKIKEQEQKKKTRKILKYIGYVTLLSILAAVTYFIIKISNTPPATNFKNALSQPLYINKNEDLPLAGDNVLEALTDSADFKIEYILHGEKLKKSGFNTTHQFKRIGKDTVSLKVHSVKSGIDSNFTFSEIFVAPEKVVISTEVDEIKTAVSKMFYATADSTIDTKLIWEIDKVTEEGNENQIYTQTGNEISFIFNEEGDYRVKVKYDTTGNELLKIFPDEKITTVYDQKVIKRGLKLETAFTPFNPVVSASPNKWWIIGLLLSAIVLLGFALKTILKKIQSLNKIIQPEKFTGIQPPYELKFSGKNKNISYTYDLLRLSNHLNKRIVSAESYFDINKTIQHSILNRGFPTPGYSQKQEARTCLFLIDQAYKNSQQVKLFSYLAMYLIQHQVKIDYYYYYQYPQKFYINEDGPRYTLQNLKDRYYKCALIFFTDGTSFPAYDAPVLKEEITAGFAFWHHRLLVTPVNFNDWGRNEKLLSNFFNVVPADVVGLLELIRAMDAENKDTPLLQDHLNTYQSKHADFNTITGLRNYLQDEELFQWICALAIHPKIYWEIILEIGKAVLSNPSKINYETLLKIARIQWIHEGTFPTKIRLELLKSLSADNEIKARAALLNMLDEISLTDDQFTFEEKQISRYGNSFVLYASGIEKFRADKNIKQGEENFIALYKSHSITDNAFKIYVEKKETADGNWDTPITVDNKSIGIEKYITEKENAKHHKIQNDRFKRNKIFAGYLLGGLILLALLVWLFFSADKISESKINAYLHLTDTVSVIQNNIEVQLQPSECLNEMLQQNNTKGIVEIRQGSTSLFEKEFTSGDSVFFSYPIKASSAASSREYIFGVNINGRSFTSATAAMPGMYDLKLVGCEATVLNITYKPGFGEDSNIVLKAFDGNRKLITIVRPQKNTVKANMLTADSSIPKKDIFYYADNLVKAGFPLKNITIRSRYNDVKNITIDGSSELEKLPVFTTGKLKALLLNDTVITPEIPPTSIVNIVYGGDATGKKIADAQSCLATNFTVNTLLNATHRTTSNSIKYYNDSFKDSINTLLKCLKDIFPEKQFDIIKAKPTNNSNLSAEIYLLDLSRHIQTVAISISDNVLLPQTNKLKTVLNKNNYQSNNIITDVGIKASTIEYHSVEQRFAAYEIKKIYSNYFKNAVITLQYSPDPKNKQISLRIKNNVVPQEKFYIKDVNYSNITQSNILPVSFNIGFQNPKSSVSKVYSANICLTGIGTVQSKEGSQCERFQFNRLTENNIKKEIELENNSSTMYLLRVTIDELKIDTVIGTVKREFRNSNVIKFNCDSLHSYVGSKRNTINYNGKNYDNFSLAKMNIDLSLVEKNETSVTVNIKTGKCPVSTIVFNKGDIKYVTFCEGTKVTLKLITRDGKLDTNKEDGALFDVSVCRSTLSPNSKNPSKSPPRNKLK